MKTLKLITTILVVSLLTLTSCQKEENIENGQNPNSKNSETAENLKRTSMYDGSFDDFLDGISCSSILLPVTATVNGTDINIITKADYQAVLDVLAKYTDDDDTIQLHFPLTVKLSDYTEVKVANQAEYDTLVEACEKGESEADDAVSCFNIDFPITILTFDLSQQQTGSVSIKSKEDLYAYITNFGNDQLFAVKYPISATANGESASKIEITSDADLQEQIAQCTEDEDTKDQAEENANEVTNILVEGTFKVKSFVKAGVETANDFANYTVDFANDLTITAKNTVDTTIDDVKGVFAVTSEYEVFVNLTFSGNAKFELLNNNWQITSYSKNTIYLQSKTDAATKLVLTQI
ncbi:hypothetical protein [Tenacibaculum sp. UWU-22]|uniref:hypothetical protein n=1 Tax=Tenacibaculum sp. UWU-22 TaxID=3234187 RepID=UPI0034DB6BBF